MRKSIQNAIGHPLTLLVCMALALGTHVGLYAQFPGGQGPQALLDAIYDAHIQSVQLAPSRWKQSAPIASLLREERLELTFDYVGAVAGYLRYRFIYCDANWQPTGAIAPEFMRGYPINEIRDMRPSSAVRPGYTHYKLEWPNRDVRLTRSGNYVIQVVSAYNEQQVLFQRQFALSEDMLPLEVRVDNAVTEDFQQGQEISARIALVPGVEIGAVYLKQCWYDVRYRKLVVRQRDVFGRQVVYGSDFPMGKEGVWESGADWRIVDLRNLNTPGQGVERLTYDAGGYHAEVALDGPVRPHIDNGHPDLNGYFAYGSLDPIWGLQGTTEEYLYAYFSLRLPSPSEMDFMPEALRGQPLLFVPGVAGAEQGVPMRYSASRQQYEASLFLKQGVYSYRYGLQKHNGIDFVATEGNYGSASQEYHVLVYGRMPGDRYDRLLAHAIVGGNPAENPSPWCSARSVKP